MVTPNLTPHPQHSKHIVANILPVKTYLKCKQWLETMARDDAIVLIVSEGFGKEIVSLVHYYVQIGAIYVYCEDRKIDNRWTQNYSKVFDTISDANKLI